VQTMTSDLSKDEVEKRLKLCEDPKVVDEVYGFGQQLMRDALQDLRSLDSKAVWLAGYGAAIITLLLSSFGTWSKLADRFAISLSVLVALLAFQAARCAVQAIRLHDLDLVSEDEWLTTECFSKIEFLKRYRILCMWRTIDSTNGPHAYKTIQVRRSERWLSRSVAVLLIMLVEMAVSQMVGKLFGGWQALLAQRNSFGFQGWHNLLSSAGFYNHSLGFGLCIHGLGSFTELVLRSAIFVCHRAILYASSL
jgi:hypothetical protein